MKIILIGNFCAIFKIKFQEYCNSWAKINITNDKDKIITPISLTAKKIMDISSFACNRKDLPLNNFMKIFKVLILHTMRYTYCENVYQLL